MTLTTSLVELATRLDTLEQHLEDLLWAVVQAQPDEAHGHTLVDQYEATTEDLISLVREAREALQSLAGSSRSVAIGPVLSLCQERHNRLVARYYSDLASYERLRGLRRMRRRWGGWASWSVGVVAALRRCAEPIHQSGDALRHCWADATEGRALSAPFRRQEETASPPDPTTEESYTACAAS